MIHVEWSDLKQLIDNGTMSYRHIELTDKYHIIAYDENFIVKCNFYKGSAESLEYEASYKTNGEQIQNSKDPETGGIQYTPRYAPPGWYQQRFETEFETSTESSIHEKDSDNQDIGWSTLKFYKDDGNGNEIECVDAADAAANAIRTDLEWMPNIDYMVKGGFVAQFQQLNEDLYVWTQGAVIDPQFGIPPKVFAEGGINMRYVSAQDKTGLDGVAGTILYYTHPQLGTGKGTNKLRFIVRHAVGKKHRLQCIFDIFRA